MNQNRKTDDLPEWAQRVIKEHAELNVRITALMVMLAQPRDAKRVSEHAWALLQIQLPTMQAYAEVLAQRIDLFVSEAEG